MDCFTDEKWMKLIYVKKASLFSCQVVSSSLQLHWLRHTRPSVPYHPQSLPKFMFIASVMLSSQLILWHPLLLLPSILPSIRDFSNESSVHIRWPWYWSFSFNISPSSENSGLNSLKIDWCDLLAALTFRNSTPQFKGINSLAFCLLYGPTLTTAHDHWEDHSLDYKDLCRQSSVSAFQHTV